MWMQVEQRDASWPGILWPWSNSLFLSIYFFTSLYAGGDFIYIHSIKILIGTQSHNLFREYLHSLAYMRWTYFYRDHHQRRVGTWRLLGYEEMLRSALLSQEFIWPSFCQSVKNPAYGSVHLQNRMVVWQLPFGFKTWIPGEKCPGVKPMFKRPTSLSLLSPSSLYRVSERLQAERGRVP